MVDEKCQGSGEMGSETVSYATRYGHSAAEQEAHDRECDGDGRGTGLPTWDEPLVPPADEIAKIFAQQESV